MNAKAILERILSDLPAKRDWLDPALEAMAREAVNPCPVADAMDKTLKVTLAAPEELPDHRFHQIEGIYEQVKKALVKAGHTED